MSRDGQPVQPAQQAGQRSTAEQELDRQLIRAAVDNDIDRAQKLIRQGASTTATDDSGETALHAAAGYGHVEMTEFLLEHGADPNMQSSIGATALHEAARNEQVEILPLLFAKEGMDFAIKDGENRTAWEIACNRNFWDVIGAFVLEERNAHLADTRDLSLPFWQWSNQRLSVNGHIFEHYMMSINSMPFFHTRLLDEINKERGVGNAGKEYMQDLKQNLKFCISSELRPYNIHRPLPLDEYCRPVVFENDLVSRETRMRDQVLVHYQSRHPEVKNHQVRLKPVVISQAWIWKSGDIIISGPEAWGSNGIWNGDFDSIWKHRKPSDLSTSIGMHLSILIDSLDDLYGTTEEGLIQGKKLAPERILDGFEKTIALVSEEVNAYVKVEGIEGIVITREGEYLHRINDVRDELAMIKRVLRQQENVWKDFASNAWPDFWPHGREGHMKIPKEDLQKASPFIRQSWTTVMKPQTKFREYERRIQQLDEDAERIERAIATKLDLKTKGATLKESHATALMSAAVFGFTIITIIFTPLSFVAALFALPIDQFQRQQMQSHWTEESGMFSVNYIGKWAATAELVSVSFTFFLMWAAAKLSLGFSLRGWLRWINGRVREILRSEWESWSKKQGTKPPEEDDASPADEATPSRAVPDAGDAIKAESKKPQSR